DACGSSAQPSGMTMAYFICRPLSVVSCQLSVVEKRSVIDLRALYTDLAQVTTHNGQRTTDNGRRTYACNPSGKRLGWNALRAGEDLDDAPRPAAVGAL